ncbi:hypothetical protein LMG27198_50960 [Methylocystis echinoides]|uniref:Uncharacterized protein n=2 Tax=Methylocystis echinoides TaxID=29468 RepID=A0A9W6H010_9HYPH|nr:hypothetical protein LMG27198_50960 [Methylocystis echinoides]
MTELLCEMTVWRDRNPGLVTFQGLVDVFNKLHAEHFRKAQERTKTTVIGTLVAACAADGISPAQIVTFDFETGAQTVVGACGSVYADGTDQAGFLEIAQSQFARFGTSDRLELDGWAIACLEQAIAARPNAVGWPADLAIVRPYPAPARLTILRRIHDSTEPLNPAFAL